MYKYWITSKRYHIKKLALWKVFFTKFKFNRVNEKCLTPVSHRMFNERQKNGTHCWGRFYEGMYREKEFWSLRHTSAILRKYWVFLQIDIQIHYHSFLACLIHTSTCYKMTQRKTWKRANKFRLSFDIYSTL